MRKVFSICVALFVNVTSAQVACDDLPIAYDPMSIGFSAGEFSFGDSMITMDIMNTSAVDMAYPQVKLVPLTPLPPGMTMTTHWATFASSWNVGQTMPASVFFDVEQPLPTNATVIFELWANNLTPLLENDSCKFNAPININLNPSGTGVGAEHTIDVLSLQPQPAKDVLNVSISSGPSHAHLVVLNAAGEEVLNTTFASPSMNIDVSGPAPGTYLLGWMNGGHLVSTRPFSVVR